jgi:hypothetical protein
MNLSMDNLLMSSEPSGANHFPQTPVLNTASLGKQLSTHGILRDISDPNHDSKTL